MRTVETRPSYTIIIGGLFVGQLETVTKWIDSGLFKGKLLDYLLKRQEQLLKQIKKGA